MEKWADFELPDGEEQESEEEFVKVHELVPDSHFVNIILKVYEIESVIV